MKKLFFLTTFVLASFFGIFSFQEINIASAAACTVNNATWSPSGEQKDDWYVAGKTKATITFNTTNCIGQTLNLDIKEADTCAVANCDDSLPDSGLENKTIKVEEVTTKVDFTVGEEACEAGPGFDCDYYFRIEKGDTLLYSSWEKAYGNLTFECDGTCFDNWKLGTITYSGGKGPIGSDGNPVSVDPTGNVVIDSDYTLLAPIGNLTVVDKTTGVGDYLNIILMIAIGLCGALAVIMIVVRGVQYMGDESVFGKTEAKHHIMQAVLGLILALGAYAILNTINPNLVGGSLTFNSVEIELEATESIGSSKYQEITGLKLLPPSQYDSKIRQVAKTEGVPYCALRVTIQRESGSGGADRIGWDSNVRNKDIKARRDFIDSQKKYSGLTFTKKADSITDKSIMNDDKTITNTDSLGLDWRFSHGIGLTQITCQPQPGVTFETRNSLPKCPVGNYTPKQLLNPEINIEAAGKMWKQFTSSSACGGDVYKTFMAYAQGNSGCSSPSVWAKQTADAKMTLYKKCLAEQ